LQIRHHSAVGLINRLEADGLVAREQAQDDRRQVYVTLTSAGAEILDQLTSAHKEEFRRIGPTLENLLQHILKDEVDEQTADSDT
jgi:DNA-binding MarR family transcriptional regulator